MKKRILFMLLFPVLAQGFPVTVPLDSLISVDQRIEIDKHRREVHASRAQKTPASVSLVSCDTEVKQQFGGTCTTFGLIGAIENLLCDGTELSARDFWNQYQVYQASTAVSVATKGRGLIESTFWPQSATAPLPTWKQSPLYKLANSVQVFTVNEIVAHLAAKKPAYVAMSTPNDMVNCKAVVSPTSPPVPNSGHALEVMGYKKQGADVYFIVKNSWGADCGIGGYQSFPASYCEQDGVYCMFWLIKSVKKEKPLVGSSGGQGQR